MSKLPFIQAKTKAAMGETARFYIIYVARSDRCQYLVFQHLVIIPLAVTFSHVLPRFDGRESFPSVRAPGNNLRSFGKRARTRRLLRTVHHFGYYVLDRSKFLLILENRNPRFEPSVFSFELQVSRCARFLRVCARRRARKWAPSGPGSSSRHIPTSRYIIM